MFTGIVERTARVLAVRRLEGSSRLSLDIHDAPGLPVWRPAVLGESIAVDGVCLSVVACEGRAQGGGTVAFDVVPETLARTTLGSLAPGRPVNIERSLAVGDVFGGHYVTGHVDGTGSVRSRVPQGDQVLFEISAPPRLLEQVLVKGSVAVDGISLTVVDVERAAGWFSFAAIPHTMTLTTLSARQPGDAVNLETDAFGKWVLHGLEQLAASRAGGGEDRERWRTLLERSGFSPETPGARNE